MPAALLADLPPHHGDPLRHRIAATYQEDETAAVEALLGELRLDPVTAERVEARARRLAHRLRAETMGQGGVEAFMHAYSLSTHEGVMLMCLAEALLAHSRCPDPGPPDPGQDRGRGLAEPGRPLGELPDQRLGLRPHALRHA